MKSITAKAILSSICLSAAALTASAGTYEYSYNTPEAETTRIGFGVADRYEIAIFIPGEPFTDFNTVVKEFTITVPVHDNIRDFRMWVSTTLSNPGTSRYFTGNICNETVDVEENDDDTTGTITYILDEPYKITSAGVYLGYSFEVSAIDPKADVTKFPVIATDDSNNNALISRLASTFPEFEPTDQYALCCTATLEGDFVENGAGVKCQKLYAKRGEPSMLKATLINHCSSPLSSIDYTCTVGEQTQTGTLNVNTSNILGSTCNISIPVDAINENGEYTGELTITKVNGKENQSVKSSSSFKAKVMERVPKHRVVAEEFSGAWCVNCTRGMAGMKLLHDTFDDFIGISYHGKDIMELKSGIPNLDYAYPNVFFDRIGEGKDPYFGSDLVNLKAGRIVDEYLEAMENFAPADIEVNATWNDDETSILINSEVTFAEVPDDGFNYRLAYVVIEDGLTGTTSDWYQRNGLAGVYALANDPYLGVFVYSTDPIIDIAYDDVAVFATNSRGIANSLPKYNNLKEGETYTHEYEAKLSDFKNTKNEQSYQNPANMHVVAMLVKQDSSDAGIICNGAKVKVPAPSAVGSIEAESRPVKTEYFDLSGRRVTDSAKGVLIMRQICEDGSVKSIKIVR